MPRIKIGEDLLYFEDRGDMSTGAVFLLVHGAAGSSQQWLPVVETLEKDHRVISLDLPGHGNSNGRGSRSVDSYVGVVRAFTSTINLSNFILCGHSLGGAIAMGYALKNPRDLSGLVLISTGARLKVSPLFLETCLEGNMEKLRVLLSKLAFYHGIPLARIHKWQQQWGYPPREVLYGDFLACNSFDYMEEVEKIQTPTLIIAGDDDRMTPLKYGYYLKEKIKGSTLEVIPESGHMLMAEKPREISRLLSGFARGISEA